MTQNVPPLDDSGPLTGKHIAVPESRMLDVFTNMLESRGATTTRCPLVAIHDSPDGEAVKSWIERFIASPPSWLVLLTGEGLRRLLGFAEKYELRDAFVAALGNTQTLVRGPKPGQALRQVKLKPTLLSVEPTTDGIIKTLETLGIQNQRICVQLYGEDPNVKLSTFLAAHTSKADFVAPYIYASDMENKNVLALIQQLIDQDIDAIAFTSMQQVKRIFKVASANGMQDKLQSALNGLFVAAVGPIVAESLVEYGVSVDVTPEDSYFMKPLTRAIVSKLSEG